MTSQWSSASQKNHHADSYFCMVNTKSFNFKTKLASSYPNIPSARRPVEHCGEVPIPVCSGLPSLQSEDSSSSQDEDDMVTDLDFYISTSFEPSPFKQEELSDVVELRVSTARRLRSLVVS